MRTRFEAARRGKAAVTALALAGGLFACAAPPPAPSAPVVPGAHDNTPPVTTPYTTGTSPVDATLGVVGATVETVRTSSQKKSSEAKAFAGSITLDCSVKLPDDPTDNPELCRSFQMEVVDETGEEAARFRFGIDARYRFPAKVGKKYRVRPLIGKNWEFTIEPDRELTVGERAHVRLRQKQ